MRPPLPRFTSTTTGVTFSGSPTHQNRTASVCRVHGKHGDYATTLQSRAQQRSAPCDARCSASHRLILPHTRRNADRDSVLTSLGNSASMLRHPRCAMLARIPLSPALSRLTARLTRLRFVSTETCALVELLELLLASPLSAAP